MSQARRKTQPAAGRGERLYPKKSHRIYWHLTALRLQLEKVIQNHVTKRRGELIDYGCGNMPYRPLFEAHVDHYLGFDLDGNEMADGLLDEHGVMQREDTSTDFVLSSQVLEHVVSPTDYLAESRRVLKDDGLLILSTHGTWKYHPDPTDYWRWTCDGLKKTISEAGFEIQHFEGVMGPAATAMQLWQDATLPKVPRFLQKPFTWTMQRLITRSDLKGSELGRNQDACIYVVVAQKT